MESKKIADDGMIDETYRALNGRHNHIYQFVMKYNDYIISAHDYGNGMQATMLEAHTLTYIEENPGITITELANYWNKTKSYLSQTVSRLVDKGFVEKRKENNNAKSIRLYVTETGRKASKDHKLYDIVDIAKTMGELQEYCSPEEIETFFKVIAAYSKIIHKDY